MRYFTLNLNDKEINLRLTSESCEKIEEAYKCSLLDYVQQGTITSLVNLLLHMRKGAGETNVTKNMANAFYDELVDAGYTMETIVVDIIYETLVVSGIISKDDLENIKSEKERIKNMSDEEKIKLMQERKNLRS